MSAAKKENPNFAAAFILSQALRILAGLCDHARSLDGIGFNKWDAQRGHEWARDEPETWSIRELRSIRKMLHKYRGQLAEHDIELPEIVEPEKHGRVIDLVGRSFRISWDLGDSDFAVLKDRVKLIPQRRWDAQERAWTVPMWHRDEVSKLAKTYKFELSTEAEVELVNQEAGNGISLDVGEHCFVVRMPYNPDAISTLKRFWREREWRRDERVWLVEVQDFTAHRVFEFAELYGLEVSEDAARRARELMDLLARVRANGAPCLGRTCDDCDASEAECPRTSRRRVKAPETSPVAKGSRGKGDGQKREHVAEQEPSGAGWTAGSAKRLFE